MGVPFGMVVSLNQGLTFILIIEVAELKLVAMSSSHRGFGGIVALQRVKGKKKSIFTVHRVFDLLLLKEEILYLLPRLGKYWFIVS